MNCPSLQSLGFIALLNMSMISGCATTTQTPTAQPIAVITPNPVSPTSTTTGTLTQTLAMRPISDIQEIRVEHRSESDKVESWAYEFTVTCQQRACAARGRCVYHRYDEKKTETDIDTNSIAFSDIEALVKALVNFKPAEKLPTVLYPYHYYTAKIVTATKQVIDVEGTATERHGLVWHTSLDKQLYIQDTKEFEEAFFNLTRTVNASSCWPKRS